MKNLVQGLMGIVVNNPFMQPYFLGWGLTFELVPETFPDTVGGRNPANHLGWC